MRFHGCDHLYEGTVYRLSPFRGDLRAFPGAMPRRHQHPMRVQQVLALCDNPYLLQPDRKPSPLPSPPTDEMGATTILGRVMRLSPDGFALVRLYASFHVPLFPDSRSAIEWFNARTPSADRDRLCLPRAMFAAKTSREFRSSGAIVIGSMLPTRSLHAWVIEQRQQPDDSDRAWVCFRPIAVLL